jgi:hypothetical protein
VAVKFTFVPEQIDVPELDAMLTDGVTEADAVTARVLAVLVPQELCAETPIDPDELPVVTAIVFVVELPVQPDGNVQI